MDVPIENETISNPENRSVAGNNSAGPELTNHTSKPEKKEAIQRSPIRESTAASSTDAAKKVPAATVNLEINETASVQKESFYSDQQYAEKDAQHNVLPNAGVNDKTSQSENLPHTTEANAVLTRDVLVTKPVIIEKNNQSVADIIPVGRVAFESRQEFSGLKMNALTNCCALSAPAGDITSGRNKIKLGVELAAGFSRSADQFKGFGQLKSVTADYVAAPASSSNLIMSRVSNAPYTVPVTASNGFAFNTGGFAEKSLARKFDISAGIRYSYFSDAMNIGNVQSSNNLNYVYFSASNGAPLFQGNGMQKYRNKYHFISFPLNIHYTAFQPGNSKIQLSIGAEYGRLIQTNAISYQSSNGGYYIEDKSVLNQNQLFGNAGIRTVFPISPGRLISLGIEHKFGLNELRKSAEDPNKTLQFTGIRIGYYLK